MRNHRTILLPKGTVVTLSGVEVTLQQDVTVEVENDLAQLVSASIPFFHEKSLRIEEE